jgi:hypothetical protein
MKYTVFVLPAIIAIALSAASCGANQEEKTKSDNQIGQPVPNSGAETEAERAKNGVKDSTDDVIKDSVGQGNDLPDTVTGSKPHH